MTDCPPKLRGDLSKWLCEINTGVYVGHVNARVRDELWERVCQNLKNGRATMVFTTNTEQKMDFRVHNTTWVPVDFDGVKLMRRPLPGNTTTETGLNPGFSKAAQYQMAQRRKKTPGNVGERYVIIDLETTGLESATDSIVEFGGIRVVNGMAAEEFSQLVYCDKELPKTIVELTHITDQMLQEEGIPLKEALAGFLDFIGEEVLMGYNIAFDMEFLRKACNWCKYPMVTNRVVDLQNLVRRKAFDLPNYRLGTVAEYFAVPKEEEHRALGDCRLAYGIYQKLNEM